MSTRNSEGDDSLFLSFVSEIKSRAKFHKKCSDGSIILNGNDIAGQKRMTQALAVEHFSLFCRHVTTICHLQAEKLGRTCPERTVCTCGTRYEHLSRFA